MKVAYAGIPGAFSHEACLRFLPDAETVQVESFDAVIAAVENGAADCGIVPLANNAAGETGTRERIGRAAVRVVDEHVLPIRMHLLGVAGSSVQGVRTVVSHPVALRQCAQTLNRLGLATEEAENTAVAASRLTDPARAVLGSETAAQLYGLAILKRDVHDRPDNATTFAVIAKAEV
jgi:prephenate dehydratase